MAKNKEQQEAAQQRLREIRAELAPDVEEYFSVLDEAVNHLYDHFNPPQSKDSPPEYRRDFMFIISKAFMGKYKDTGELCYMNLTHTCGNMHELAHELAESMHEDPTIKEVIYHALHVYAHTKPKKP